MTENSEHQNSNVSSSANEDYAQEGNTQSLNIVNLESLIGRVDQLSQEIETLSTVAEEEEDEIDYVKIEELSREIEAITRKIERTPVTSVSIARIKIAFFMNLLKQDHADPVRIDVFKHKILGVFSNYTSSDDDEDYTERG